MGITHIDGLTLTQAAHRLGLSTVVVRQLIAAGKLRGIWTPYGYLADAADVKRLARERAVRPRRGRRSER